MVREETRKVNCFALFFKKKGDLEVIMSQFGIITDLRIDRDADTGKSKGYGWVSYADWRSTVLAVDNFNGVELLGRKIGCDHALKYVPPPPEEGLTWWEQKQKAERKKQKKEKKKKKERKEKKEKKEEVKRQKLSGGLLLKGTGESLRQNVDGSLFIDK